MTLYPPDGGVTRHVVDLVEGLDAERWSVEIACPPGTEPWLELSGRSNVRLNPLAPGKHPGLSDLADLRRILRLAATADVVHAHASKAGFLSRLAAALRRQRATTVFTPHSWSFWAEEWRSRVWLALERRAANWGGAIVTVSEAERRAGIAAGVGSPGQYHLIRNGIDPRPFSQPRRTVGGRILVVGRLAAQKRTDVALRALAHLREKHPHAHLDVVAHGPLEEETVSLAAELGLRDAVSFLGKRNDVPRLLSEAECFLLTSDHEGCPYTVLEAMAAGVPVVATRVGGVPELVADGETGILIERRDPQAAAAAVGRILESATMGIAFGEAGRRRVAAEFGREQMVRSTVALYDALI